MSVEQAHQINRISDKEPDVFHEEDGDVLAEIDFDPEAELPIFGYARENGSHVVFLILSDPSRIRVLYVSSKDEGDMKHMIDFIVKRFGINQVNFFNLLDQQSMLRKLTDVSTKTVKVNDEKLVIAQCNWDPDR